MRAPMRQYRRGQFLSFTEKEKRVINEKLYWEEIQSTQKQALLRLLTVQKTT